MPSAAPNVKKQSLRNVATKTVVVVASLALAYVSTALALVFWPEPVFKGAPTITPEMQAMSEKASGLVREQVYPFTPRTFTTRDGEKLFARDFGASSRITVVFMHGVASDSEPSNVFSGLLNQLTGARVIAFDHRGHGQSGGKPWAVDHAGQYEEDVADIIAEIRKQDPQTRIILGGHSMGGGIALRYALRNDTAKVDGYLLMAPLFGSDSPSMKLTGSPAEAKIAEMFVKFRAPRLIGVVMLDSIGVTAFNDEPILLFNRPGMPAYGYAALQSMQPNSPDDYRAALSAIDAPLLLVAGDKDEAFNAAAYEGIIRQYSKGETALIEGASHSGVTSDPRTAERIAQWLSASESHLSNLSNAR